MRYPDLREHTYKVLTNVLPVIEAAVNGQPAILSPADAADIEDLLETFAAKGSSKLKSAIQKIESDFYRGKFVSYFGIDVEDSY